MIAAAHFSGRKVALFGLGGSGMASAQALKAGGAQVYVWDDQPQAQAKARAAGLDVHDLRALDWSGLAALVLAPGVPLTHPKPHWTVERAKDDHDFQQIRGQLRAEQRAWLAGHIERTRPGHRWLPALQADR